MTKPNMTIAWAETGTIIVPDDTRITDGWASEKPPYQTFNWVINRADSYLQHLDGQGIPEWSAEPEYSDGSLAMYNGVLCRSLQDSNIGNAPGTAGWWNEGAYVSRFGDTMLGNLVVKKVDPSIIIESEATSSTALFGIKDESGALRFLLWRVTSTGSIYLDRRASDGQTTEARMTVKSTGNFGVDKNAPIDANDLTRKDYVDGKSTALLALNGWHKDENTGIITQWGIGTFDPGGSTITFPIPFPHSCRSLVLTPHITTVTSFTAQTTALGSATFSAHLKVSSTGNDPAVSLTAHWQAIGY